MVYVINEACDPNRNAGFKENFFDSKETYLILVLLVGCKIKNFATYFC